MLTFLDGSAPPPVLDPEYIPSAAEAFLSFMLGYLLLVMCVLWILPRRWTEWVFGRVRDEE